MTRNDADTRTQLIDPALHKRGWTEDLIRREETAGAVDVVDGRARRRARGRADYVLRVRAQGGPHPVAVALIEAKAEHLPPLHGLEQAKLYAAREIVRRDIFLDDKLRSERETGVERADLANQLLADARTGEVLMAGEAREHYEARDLEAHLLLPERVAAMCHDLFQHLLITGGPEQKSIVFCARDDHADRVAAELNNLYAGWCRAQGRARLEPYAFKCTAASGGQDFVPDLRGALRHHFVATTVDLLTTGVDVPCVRNVVFFKYVHSPIAFHQMAGRGTRIDPPRLTRSATPISTVRTTPTIVFSASRA